MNKMKVLIFSLLFSISLYAQQRLPGPASNQKEINGYKVVVIPAARTGYGYMILQNNKPVVIQVQNTIPSLPGGIRNPDDAFRIAEWQIKEHQAHGHWTNMIPPYIALGIKKETH